MNAPLATSPMHRFLADVRVLDLSQYIPGPMATLYLADFGADVLKIEPPAGDQMMHLGPRDEEGHPTFYRALNAGKTVRRMNLKNERERQEFLDLVREADVVVEGFRPGVMKRLGIDYTVLSKINAGIVMCSISGYGSGSPMASKAGHDANYLALTGVMSRNGRDAPMFFDPPIADMAGALYAGMAILAALHGRARTGLGCAIDLALADTLMPLQMMQVADHGVTGNVPRAGGTYLNGGAAYYNVYRTSDGRHVVLGAVEPKFWRNFCIAAQRNDWLDRHEDAIPQSDLQQEIAAFFASMTAQEATAVFDVIDCCLSLVQDLRETMAMPHIANRGLVRRAADDSLQALFPVRIDGAAPATRTAVVTLNESRPTEPEASMHAGPESPSPV
jgi:alpha-methylacyl-CoA racemase